MGVLQNDESEVVLYEASFMLLLMLMFFQYQIAGFFNVAKHDAAELVVTGPHSVRRLGFERCAE